MGEFGELLTGSEAVNLEGKPIDVSEADVIKLMGALMEQFTNTTNPEKRNESIVQYGLTSLSKLTVRF